MPTLYFAYVPPCILRPTPVFTLVLSGQDIMHVYQGAIGWKSAWKTAYKSLALRLHPDKIKDVGDLESAKMAWNHLVRLREEGEGADADFIEGRPPLPPFSIATENKNLQVHPLSRTTPVPTSNLPCLST